MAPVGGWTAGEGPVLGLLVGEVVINGGSLKGQG